MNVNSNSSIIKKNFFDRVAINTNCTRVKFTGIGEEERGGSSRDRTIPPQKTQLFKGSNSDSKSKS